MTRVHLVGWGLIGKKRLSNLDTTDELITVSDPKFIGGLGKSALIPCVMVFSDYREALSLVEEDDAVIISTPHNQLAPIASDFAELGCHILIEKPGGLSASEIEGLDGKMILGKALAVGYNHRFHPSITELFRMAESNQYGSIIAIRARYGHGGRKDYESEWRMAREISGGGQLMDQGSHLIDLVRRLVGSFDIKSCTLANTYWDSGVEDSAIVTGLTSTGGLVGLNVSCTEWKNVFSFEVFFHRAKIEIRGLGGSYGAETLVTYEMPNGFGIPTMVEQEFDGPDLSWQAEWHDFKARIEGRSGVGASATEALAVLRQIEECYSIANR